MITTQRLLRHLASHRGSIKCYTAEQRNDTVKFISEEFGYMVGRRTSEYMEQNPHGTEYMYVELYDTGYSDVISLSIHAINMVISFREIAHLIALEKTEIKIDTRTEQEFSEAFAALMS